MKQKLSFLLTLLITFYSYSQIANQPSPLSQCDTNGVSQFDLTSANNEVLGAQSPADFSVTYYISLNDAETATNALISPYTNTTNPETIFVRLEDINSGNFDTTTLQLEVLSTPDVSPPTALEYCDDDGDGFGIFTLTNANSGITGGNSNLIVSYYETSTDAYSGTNPIINDYYNTIPNTQTVFARVENPATGCNSIVSLELIVNSTPPSITLEDSYDICVGSSLTLNTNIDTNIYDAVWYYESPETPGILLPLGAGPTMAISLPGIYIVEVWDLQTNCFISFNTTVTNSYDCDISCDTPLNVVFCYNNNDTIEYTYTSPDGSPLNLVFNSGLVENLSDAVSVIDSDGVNDLNAATPYGNAGDLSGLAYQSTGNTISVIVQADNSGIACTDTPIDITVTCAGSNAYGFIKINPFLDENNDGVFNNSDTPFINGFFTYEVNNNGVTNTIYSSNGTFLINNAQDSSNSYDFTYNVTEQLATCYNLSSSILNNISVANESIVEIDYPITIQMDCEDVGIYLVSTSLPRPGFTHDNKIVIYNHGNTIIDSGSIEFTHDPTVNFLGLESTPTIGIVTTTATGFTYDFTNLEAGDNIIMKANMATPASVPLGNLLTNTVEYIANDVIVENNNASLTQTVVGSYDPNDITESYGEYITYNDFTTTNEYLYYTIRFQNVGTAEAINVRIENTLSTLLDVNTLELLHTSHDAVMHEVNGQITWTFDDINLPAESQDEAGSNGYVLYKIKLVAGYNIGTIIPNTAEIYFDFNAPVITNTFNTEFVEHNLSVNEFSLNTFTIYPNPAKDILYIKTNTTLTGSTSIKIIDIQGKQIITKTIDSSVKNSQLNISSLQKGIYFVKLESQNKVETKKLIIK